MKFAKTVFFLAGIWGIVVLTPLFWLVDLTGRPYAPPVDYPHFFYGFLAVAMAWQLAFLLIATDPLRYRPLMIAAIVEKAGYVATVSVLYPRGRISALDAQTALPDLILGLLFVVALLKTKPASRSRS